MCRAISFRSVGEFGAPQQISTGFASWLRYCTDVAQRRSTKHCRMFDRLLGWYTVSSYIHFGGCCPVTEFCQVQNSLCVLQVLGCPILAALLHGTRAVSASRTLRRSAHGATYIRQGDHHVWHWPIGPHSSLWRVSSLVDGRLLFYRVRDSIDDALRSL